MSKENQSFFEKLTGTVVEDESTAATVDTALPEKTTDSVEEIPDNVIGVEDDENETDDDKEEDEEENGSTVTKPDEWLEEVSDDEGQLTIDVYQTPVHVVVQAPMAGVKPDDVDVSINNDMVTIRGKRDKKKDSSDNEYYYRELFWGPFSRSVLLPVEIDSDRTEASFKNGLLTIKMPKIEKENTQRVKIQTKEI